MSAVGTGKSGQRIDRTVGVARITVVGIAKHGLQSGKCVALWELSLAVGHPDTEPGAAKVAEQHTVVLRNVNAEECALKLMARVVLHAERRLRRRLAARKQPQFHHQLAPVAHAERERVVAHIETLQHLSGPRVKQEGAGPSLGTSQHVGIGKSAAVYDKVHVVQGFASRHQVGHGHIPDFEAGLIEHVGHFTLAVGSFLAQYGGANGFGVGGTVHGGCATRIEAHCLETPVEVLRQPERNGLLAVVFSPCVGALVCGLQPVEGS